MVKGYMDALPQYSEVGIPAEYVDKIKQYVNMNDLAVLPCGKYEIDGERIYVSIQEYRTKSYLECQFETHRKYADIQYIIWGREQIWVAQQAFLTQATEYDPGADIQFWKDGSANLLDLCAGELALLLPGEAHKPCVQPGEVTNVKKAVFKIAL